MENAVGDSAELAIAIDSRVADFKECSAKVSASKTTYKALRKRIDNAIKEAREAKADIEPLQNAADTLAEHEHDRQLEWSSVESQAHNPH